MFKNLRVSPTVLEHTVIFVFLGRIILILLIFPDIIYMLSNLNPDQF